MKALRSFVINQPKEPRRLQGLCRSDAPLLKHTYIQKKLKHKQYYKRMFVTFYCTQSCSLRPNDTSLNINMEGLMIDVR